MSGPKVVRVVTREELVAQGESVLARLDQELSLWRDQCVHYGQISEEDFTKAVLRRNELEALLRADQFQSFTREANNEIEYLKSYIETRRQVAIEAKARERSRNELGRQNAIALAKALREKSNVANENLIAKLESAAKGRPAIADIDQLLSQGIRLLSDHTASELMLTEAQRQLASRLASGESTQTLEHWKTNQVKIDPRVESLHRLIAELSILDDVSVSVQLETQLSSLLESSDTSRFALRLDSLLIDARNAITNALAFEQAKREIQTLAAELKSAGIDITSWQEKVNQACHQKSDEILRLLAEEGRNNLSSVLRSKAAIARRQAVLHGLAKLGYAVQEGMATTLAQDGRLVIKKPDMPGYGIEVAGAADSERIQVRTVALSASRDATRDIDAESRWCQDFTKLQSELRVAGSQLVIEKALPVGAVPLRVVEIEAEQRIRNTTGVINEREQ